MDHNLEKNRGLTRIILESLIASTSQLVEEGESWSPEILARLEDELCRRLAPQDSVQNQMIFDMVFRRSFGEAKQQLLALDHAPRYFEYLVPSPCREALA